MVRRITALIALFVAACGFAPPAMAAQAKTVVPYDDPTGDHTPVVPVRLNDTVDARFLLDTGSNITFVKDSLARSLSLRPAPLTAHGVPFLLHGKPTSYVRISRLQVGLLSAVNSPLIVLPASQFRPGVDGVLGANFMTQFAILIDPSKREVSLFSPGGLSKEELVGLGMDDASVLPLEDSNNDFVFHVPLRLNGQIDTNMILDTGARYTEIGPAVATELHLPSGAGHLEQSFLGENDVCIAPLRSIAIGNDQFKNVSVTFSPSTPALLPPHVGMDLLSRFRVLVDIPQHKLYLKPASSQPASVNKSTTDRWATPLILSGLEPAPLVQIVLADGKPHFFAIGIGTPACQIDTHLSEQLGLVDHTVAGPNNQSVTVAMADLKIGAGAPLKGIPLTPADSTPLRRLLPHVDGVLGANLLSHFVVTIDYTHHQIQFQDTGEPANPGVGWTALPMRTNADGTFAIDLMLDGDKTAFYPSTLEQHTLLDGANTARPARQAALELEGGAHLTMGLFSTLQVGPKRLSDTTLLTPSWPITSNVLGLDVLRDFNMVVDYPHGILYVKPDETYHPSPDASRGTGLLWTRSGGGEIVVSGLVTPSPAQAAGIRVGDTIAQVDGVSTTQLTDDKLRSALKKPIGSSVALVIHHANDGKPLKVRLKVIPLP